MGKRGFISRKRNKNYIRICKNMKAHNLDFKNLIFSNAHAHWLISLTIIWNIKSSIAKTSRISSRVYTGGCSRRNSIREKCLWKIECNWTKCINIRKLNFWFDLKLERGSFPWILSKAFFITIIIFIMSSIRTLPENKMEKNWSSYKTSRNLSNVTAKLKMENSQLN